MKRTLFIFLMTLGFIASKYPLPDPSSYIPDSCKKGCPRNIAYEEIIGVNNNVPSYSNCNDNCDYSDTKFEKDVTFKKENNPYAKDIYVGWKWQCVEYSRRWLIVNKGFTYGAIPGAVNIFDLRYTTNLINNDNHIFESYLNKNVIPPEHGDLLIFSKAPDAPYGHVAVIVNVNVNDGYIDIAEQNFSNKWENPKEYSRRLFLLKCGENNDLFTVTEIGYNKHGNLRNQKPDCNNDYQEVIGYKRVGAKSS